MRKSASGVQKVGARLDTIAAAVSERGGLKIEDAAAMLEVSSMTVRRDLASASDRFSLLGGHIVAAAGLRSYDIGRQTTLHASAKRAAALKAAELVRDGDAIFIDCGTTTAHLARVLPPGLRLTVVCYALNIAEPLTVLRNIELIVLGGRYMTSSASFEVMECEKAFSRFALSKAFISAAGVHAERGVTCMNFHEVAVKQNAMKVALQRILVIDSSKIDAIAPAAFAELDRFEAVVVGGAAPTGDVGRQLGSRIIVADLGATPARRQDEKMRNFN